MSTITLQSKEMTNFVVDEAIAKKSVIIKSMIEECGLQEDNDEPVALPNISTAILEKVIEWCTYHKNDPAPPPEKDEDGIFKEKRTDDISPWDTEFLSKLDQGTLLDLMMAANFLEITGLFEVTCKSVAHVLKSQSPDEIRKTYNIQNDFNEEEKKQIRKEREWMKAK